LQKTFEDNFLVYQVDMTGNYFRTTLFQEPDRDSIKSINVHHI